MSNDDLSPERTRTDRVADWVDTTQGLGGSPSRVDAVADATRREGSDETTGATPSIDAVVGNVGDSSREFEAEMGQLLDTAESTDLGSPSQRAEGTGSPSEHAEASPDFGMEWPLDGGRSDSGSTDGGDPWASDPGFSPNVGADDFGGVGDSGFSPDIDDSGFTGGDDSGFTGADDSGFFG